MTRVYRKTSPKWITSSNPQASEPTDADSILVPSKRRTRVFKTVETESGTVNLSRNTHELVQELKLELQAKTITIMTLEKEIAQLKAAPAMAAIQSSIDANDIAQIQKLSATLLKAEEQRNHYHLEASRLARRVNTLLETVADMSILWKEALDYINTKSSSTTDLTPELECIDLSLIDNLVST